METLVIIVLAVFYLYPLLLCASYFWYVVPKQNKKQEIKTKFSHHIIYAIIVLAPLINLIRSCMFITQIFEDGYFRRFEHMDRTRRQRGALKHGVIESYIYWPQQSWLIWITYWAIVQILLLLHVIQKGRRKY